MTAPIGSFSGIASGIDYKALVDQIIQVERTPAVQLERQVSTLSARKTAWGTYRGILGELSTAAKALRGGDAFGGRSVSVSGTASGGRPILSATAGASTVPGQYQIEVRALARTGTGSTAAQPTSTGAILPGGATSATLTVNGQTITIDGTNNSLEGFRDAVNNANAGVTAYVVQTGTGASLVLKSRTSGANGLQVAETGGTGLLTSLGWTADAGADASLVVDGVLVTRASNVVGDIVPGLSLTLQTAETGTIVQLGVTQDQSATKTAINAFVTAYNKLVDFVRQQTPTGATGNARPPLASETSLATQARNLARTLQDTFATGTEGAQTLSQAGLRLGRDGRLSFTPTAYDTLAGTSETALRQLFTDRLGAAADYADSLLQSTSGAVAVQTQSIDRQVTRLNDRVADIDARLARRREALTRQFVAMEAALSRINNQTAAVSGQLAALSGR